MVFSAASSHGDGSEPGILSERGFAAHSAVTLGGLGAGRTGRGQLDKAQVLPDLLVKISMKADLLRIKSLGAVNVCDRYRNQFEFHLHGRHGCFPLSLYLTLLLLQVYPERRTESILLSGKFARRGESPEE